MGKRTKLKIELNLDSIKVKRVTIDPNGDYHIYVSCTCKSTLCHKCGKKITISHGQRNESIIEHLPILDQRVWVRLFCDEQ